MRVTLDRSLCKGHGQCVLAAPEVFEFDDDDIARLLMEVPGEELRGRVEDAARRCPERAIQIEG